MKSLQMLSKIALLNINNNNSNFEYKINKTLKIIGEHTNVSRVYIFLDKDNSTLTRNQF